MALVKVGSVQTFPENQTKLVHANGKPLVIARWSGGFYAMDESCTHAHATLAEADIDNGVITCPLHGARFSVTTGQALSLPAVEPVKMYPVKVEGDNVLVDL
jgi:3-phenylpropionate/trans-cinnamate dioxygenase ferredoxin subunit